MKRPRVLYVGRTTLDVLYRLDAFPQEDTKVFASATRMVPGGPAANAAITHALLMGEAALLTALGRRPRAGVVRRELERHRISVIDLADGTAYETPLATVLVNTSSGTRTVVNPPPSPVNLSQVEKWDEAWGALPRLILCDGFRVRETLPLLQRCREEGIPICLDGGSWKPGTEELVPLLTVAICSERFRVPDLESIEDADPDATLQWLQARGVSCSAITRGPRSIVGLENGRRFEIEIQDVHAVDTLGAGDVLHGAFCLRYAATGDFEGSLRFASVIATQSCKGLGIGAWRAKEEDGGL